MKPIWAIATATFAVLTVITGASGCRRHPETHPDLNVAARMDDSLLTISDIEKLLPSGLTAEDSTALADAITEGWIEDRLFETYLSPDPAEEQRIERMVRDYRRKLRMEAYRRRMRRLHEPPVKADSIRAYYDAHRSELICEHPLTKGLYLKIPSGSSSLARLRQWSRSASNSDILKIEEESGSADFTYEYFGDTWVEFDIIASEIPYRFGDADRFLSSNTFFETEVAGFVYILHIYSYLPSESPMPYEFAEIQIRDILQESRLEAYRRGLLKALKDKAVKDGRLSIANHRSEKATKQ